MEELLCSNAILVKAHQCHDQHCQWPGIIILSGYFCNWTALFSLAAAPAVNGSIIYRTKDGATALLELLYSGEPKPRIYVRVPYRDRQMTRSLFVIERRMNGKISVGDYAMVRIRKQLKNRVVLRMDITRKKDDRMAVRQGAAVWIKIFVQNPFGEANTKAFTFQGRSKHR